MTVAGAREVRSRVGTPPWRDGALLALGALVIRLPAFFASRHLLFDDGTYGVSAVEMRHGAMPFRDLFSPQGPLHLVLVYVADVVGLHTLNGPRVLPVAA